MSKSGSRYGRRSNWFKIHCLLQEQQQQHHQHQQHQQHPHQHPTQHPQHQPSTGVHFQQQQHSASGCRMSLEPGRTPPPLWTDVKHHLRLDADNNNSVAGDLNKDSGRLSVSAAATAVAQVVRPELLRWPSPFFSAFPFPPHAPFFLALQQQQQLQQQRSTQQPPPLPPSTTRGHRSPRSPSYRSSTDDEYDDSGDREDDDDGPPPSKRVAVCHELPPVQELPMDLSVTASLPSRPPSRGSPSLSPHVQGGGGGGSPGHSPDRSRRRRRRPRRRRRRPVDFEAAAADRTSGSDDCATETDSATSDSTDDARPAKTAPLDLTCNRS